MFRFLFRSIPPAPPPAALHTCSDFKTRWEARRDAAVAYYAGQGNSNPSQRQIHLWATSRQCWQYSIDGQTSCESGLAQWGHKGDWWSGCWSGGACTFTNAGTFLDEYGPGYENPEDGHFIMCSWKSGSCGNDFNTDMIQLNTAHSAYLAPYCNRPTAPLDPSSYTQCAADGPYRVDISFPAGSAAEVCPSSTELRLGVVPGPSEVVYLVAPPPSMPSPPAHPPPPPPSPPPPSYTVEIVVNDPVTSAPACRQKTSFSGYEEDVESAAECLDALGELGIASSADAAMASSAALYADGFRCYSNASSTFVWASISNLPASAFVCRRGGTPVGASATSSPPPSPPPYSSQRRALNSAPMSKLAPVRANSPGGYFYSTSMNAHVKTFDAFHRNVSVAGTGGVGGVGATGRVVGVTRADVGLFFHQVCGTICVVDDALDAVVYDAYACSGASFVVGNLHDADVLC